MKKIIISLVVGIVLLVILFYTIGIQETISLLAQTDLYLFLYAGIVYLLMEFVLSMKLKVLVPELGIKQTFLSHQGGMFFGNLTPGRAGYYYASYSTARKTKTSISEKVGLITLMQGLTMISKIAILVVAFFYLSFIIEIPLVLLLAFAVPAAVIIATFFILYTKTPFAVLEKIPLLNHAVRYLNLMQFGVKNFRKMNIVKLFSIDIISWVLSGLQFYILAAALGINISLLISIFFVQIISVLMFIPISPAGLGITEGGGVFVFLLLGFSAPQAISLILLWRVHSILFDGITGIWDISYYPSDWMRSITNHMK